MFFQWNTRVEEDEATPQKSVIVNLALQQNNSHHLAKKMLDFESMLLHFGLFSHPKMDAKPNQHIVRKQIPSKFNQNGVNEIDQIQVNHG